MSTVFGKELHASSLLNKPFLLQGRGASTHRITLWNGNSFRYQREVNPISLYARKIRPSRLNGVITHAFLGVGAPEAVLVGVVALVLFGPKGLAQAAKSLGQGVKAIAPTLKELTDISTDLKSTIEDEIGLNEIRDELQSTLSPISKPRPVGDVANLKDDDPDIAAKREESAKLAWSIDDDSGSLSSVQRKEVDSMSVEELEAELMRRKASEL